MGDSYYQCLHVYYFCGIKERDFGWWEHHEGDIISMLKKIVQIMFGFSVLFVSSLAYAQVPGAEAHAADLNKGMIALAACLAIAITAFGGALGQGKAATAALEGIARNPAAADKLFVPMILCVSFIESLVIFALLIAFQLVGKI